MTEPEGLPDGRKNIQQTVYPHLGATHILFRLCTGF